MPAISNPDRTPNQTLLAPPPAYMLLLYPSDRHLSQSSNDHLCIPPGVPVVKLRYHAYQAPNRLRFHEIPRPVVAEIRDLVDLHICLYTLPAPDQRKYSSGISNAHESVDSPKEATPTTAVVADKAVFAVVFLIAL